MKKHYILLLMVAVSIVISGCTPYQQPQVAPQVAPQEGNSEDTLEIEIKGFAFNPATITVKKGTTVKWTNKDGIKHTATGSGFDTGSLSKEGSGSTTFNEAGTFNYVCSIHPSMKGTIIVE